MAAPALSLPLPLLDRVAIVTGSSRGIGKAIALHLGSLGARLVINYTSNKDQAELVAAELNSSSSSSPSSAPPRAITVQANVSDPAQVKTLFDEAERSFGGLQVHILVNSAGVLDSKYPSIANTSVEDFDNTFGVNTRGAFLCCKEAANRMKRGGGGRIILLSSSMVGGLKPGFGAYTASKAAAEAMVKILAKELKGTGITANCVAPGPVATEIYYAGKSEEMIQRNIDESPLGRIGEPKDIATVVGFLATDSGEWINGQAKRRAVVPSLHKRYLSVMVDKVFCKCAQRMVDKLQAEAISGNGVNMEAVGFSGGGAIVELVERGAACGGGEWRTKGRKDEGTKGRRRSCMVATAMADWQRGFGSCDGRRRSGREIF